MVQYDYVVCFVVLEYLCVVFFMIGLMLGIVQQNCVVDCLCGFFCILQDLCEEWIGDVWDGDQDFVVVLGFECVCYCVGYIV